MKFNFNFNFLKNRFTKGSDGDKNSLSHGFYDASPVYISIKPKTKITF